ncbi:hypothetical protein KC332_g14036 [Hortaea werneckii]|uniref:SMODS and SLOG-associating 2TM effector domain-containing protein n=2 Tax=Hortaea werneckii TaxID=91943 RepID=A0A3M7IKG8_HORWE|nr:hypothetical protein KC358_g14098 [Hortaea werneckii]OTA23382.1 hypothetical protein BTJ68_14187 [Hortaea werneckii EXF-2000]KAI6807777.1 hypothetical protein KC350_g13635 [Hortaea werneckii]KAI6908297.1 hypothetical protein KC348_g13892 [Hortaea werneckii]KAI6925200.1 hypothetical protein KC341_g13583 [Hortaea werneckii]
MDDRAESSTEKPEDSSPFPSSADHGRASEPTEENAREQLVRKAKAAEQRWRAAPLNSKEREQALNEFLQAEDTLKQQENEVVTVISEAMIPTKQLWQEVNQRDVKPVPPKSAASKLAPFQSLANAQAAQRPPRKVDSQQSGASNGTIGDPGHACGPDGQDSETQRDSQLNASPAEQNRRFSLRNPFSTSTHEDGDEELDLEAGTRQVPEKAGRTDDYDVHGRKRIFAPRRNERIVDQVPRKVNYGPAAASLPEPTYLDKHGLTELEVFQAMVGIHFLSNAGAPIDSKAKTLQPASVMSDIFLPSRAAAYRHRNRGLYDRCISQDMKMRVMYSFSHYMISFLYLLQILVAATLTGLSSYSDTAGVAITTLGAINTVLAGILAWLNGQGMPVRYRRSRDQFREVVRAIEDAERMFSTIDYMDWPDGTRPTPLGERDKLFKMYEKARQDQEANYPDTHEDANKTEVANRTKDMESKIEKHKKQKKAKDEALQRALAKLEKKSAPRPGNGTKFEEFEATAVDSNQDDEMPSTAEVDKKIERLEGQQAFANNALANLAFERSQAKKEFEEMQHTIKAMCAEENLDEHSVREKVKNKVKGHS